MYGIDHYFAKENTGVPYTDAAENLGDYFSLILYLGDLAVAWKNERDGDGDVLPRGICSTDALPEAVLSYTETAPPERRISPFEPVIQEAVRESLSYIHAREDAVEKEHPRDAKAVLRLKNIIDAFSLTRRETLVLLTACSARRDIRMAELFSYIAGDARIRDAGTPTAGLCDTLLHLVFSYEETQGESIVSRGGKLMRYLMRAVSGEADSAGNQALFSGVSPLGQLITVRDEVYRYLLFGEGAFSISPEAAGKDAPLYFAAFTEQILEYENPGQEGFVESQRPRFCYIEATDAEDVKYALGRAFAEKDIPLYVMEQETLSSPRGDLFFSLRMLMFLRHAKLLVYAKKPDGSGKEKDEKEADRLEKTIRLLGSTLFGMDSTGSVGTVYLTGREHIPPLALHGKDMPAVITLSLPDVDARINIWKDLLDAHGLLCDEGIDLNDIADCHGLSFAQIRSIVEKSAATIQMTSKDHVLKRELLQKFIFSLSTADFEHLATFIPARYTWEDIFLEESQKSHLKNACDRFRLRNRTGREWGINRKNAYGNAVIVLFYGPPGTGKTMAAQVVANEVMTPLYRVDVSQIFSKYIGETQKNLSKIFDEAEKRSVVLFFDEADALFTRRTDIRDSHDKYANSDTSFLLQKVEEYSGISILATNNFQSMDPAFSRRLTYTVRFEKPDENTREKMWKTILPEEVPLAEDIDFAWLAEQFTDFSGSNIKSILMTAAYMAAAENTALSMRHLVLSTKYEFEKLGRLVGAGDFGRYAGFWIE